MDYKKLRLAKGATQMDVAKAAGISLTAYQLIERGVTATPRAKTVEKIMAFLKEDSTNDRK